MTQRPYDIARSARHSAPNLPGEAIVRGSADEAIDALASDMHAHALNCVRAFGDFHLALSGGRTLQPLYLRLMFDPALRAFPWQRTHLWLTSERWTATDGVGEVFEQLRDTIIEHSDIPRPQVHPVGIALPDAANAYERTLKESLAWREKGHDRLDLALLSVGANGRVCGVTDARVDAAQALVAPVESEHGEKRLGVTLTLRMLNAARLLAILATGPRKAAALAAVASADSRAPALPVRALAPVGGALRWYVDAEACAACEPLR